jgi:hypothetical protein
MLQKIN